MKIAFCHTKDDVRREMERIIQSSSYKMGISIICDNYEQPQTLIQALMLKKLYNLYIIGLYDKELTNILMNKVAAIDKHALFILIDNEQHKEEFMVCSIKLPLCEIHFRKIINNAVSIIKNQELFCYKSGKLSMLFPYNNILYFESFGRKITVNLATGQYEYNGTLKEIIKNINPHQFIRINKSYIINLLYVEYVELNNIHMNNKQVFNIGKIYREHFYNMYDNYMEKFMF